MSWTTPVGKTHQEQLAIAEARQLARRKEKSHSSYWMQQTSWDYTDEEKKSTEYLMKLNSLRQTMANFAFMILGRHIPVKFSTGQDSYASIDNNQKEELVISATTDPTKFDANVGVVMHEASHIKWTKFSQHIPDSIPWFAWLKRFVDANSVLHQMPEDVFNLGMLLGLGAKDMQKDMKFIMNVMEDRRIDLLMYEEAGGWRKYYEAMYDEYWHTPQISKGLLSQLSREPRVDNYRFHICNMTNELADPTALPGLQEIWDLINLKDIKRFGRDPKWQSWHTLSVPHPTLSTIYPFDALPDMVQTGFNILRVIYTHSKTAGAALPDPKKGKAKFKKGDKFIKGDPNNHDIGDGQELSLDKNDYTEEEFAELMKAIEEMVNGKYDKEALESALADAMQHLQDSEAVLTDVGDEFTGKAKCLVYRKLTESLINSKDFIFGAPRYQKNVDAIMEGISLGNVLYNKIKVLAEESTISFTRQPTGKLDKRLIHSLGYSTENVFEQTLPVRYDPIFIHLSLDSSGSMAGDKWFQAMKLATALAKVAEKIRTVDLVISLRASDDDMVKVLIAYDSRIDPFNKIVSLFPRLAADGGTPEGLAFDALKDIIDENDRTKRRKYFINVSDGGPNFYAVDATGTSTIHYAGDTAHSHTRRRIQAMKNYGVQVMSYFVGGAYDGGLTAFQTMYGSDAQFVDVQNVSDIARTINNMMIKGEKVLDKSV